MQFLSEKKTILIPILLLVLGFILGWYFGFAYSNRVVSGLKEELQQKETLIEKAKSFFPSSQEVRLVSGTIKEVKESSIIIQVQDSANPFDDTPRIREVLVRENTKIIKQTPKDQTVITKELESYQKSLQLVQQKIKVGEKNVVFPQPPSYFNEKEITLEDLNINDQVAVDADSNIKLSVKFEAAKITLLTSTITPSISPEPNNP